MEFCCKHALAKSQQTARFAPTIEQNARLRWRFANRPRPMDATDQQLIALLRDNARTPVTALAQALRVSRATVQNRIDKLEQEGLIVGYTVRLRPEAEAHRIRAWMTVAVDGNKTRSVLQALRGEPNVQALHTTNGRWDIIAELRAETLEAFDRALDRIRLIDGISATETSILLSTYK